MLTITIGEWIEPESRDVHRCPSYYAADYEVLRTTPGRYPLRLTFEDGYIDPIPYWLLVRIPAQRIDGATFSGFGGVNFASRPLPKEDTHLPVQMYAYELPRLVAAEWVVVRPEFAGLVEDRHAWASTQTWESLKALAGVTNG